MTMNQETLFNENAALRGWVEVLMTLKDKMLVSIPELQAEMRGLRTGMELEKMKCEMTSLKTQLATANTRLAQFEQVSSSGDEEDRDHPGDLFVHPREFRSSQRAMSLPTATYATHVKDGSAGN